MAIFKPRGPLGVIGAPLIEFHQVNIHANQVGPLQIYGTIKVTNSAGHTSYLYNTTPEEYSDTLYSGDPLYIVDMLPVLLPFPVTTVCFKLLDKTNGLVLADNTLTLDYTNKYFPFEEPGDENVFGKDGFVNVLFTTFNIGVIAYFSFKLYKRNDVHPSGDDDDDDGISLLGKISASCECEYNFARDFEVELLLCRKNPVLVRCGDYIPLDKTRMAVQAYSSIRITVSFKNIIDDAIIFPVARPGVVDACEIKGFDDYAIRVGIDWVPGMPRGKIPKSITNPRTDKSTHDDSATTSTIRREAVGVSRDSVLVLTEVYSVDVIPDENLCSDEVINLHGFVDMHILFHEHRVFEATPDCPISLRPGEFQTIPFGGPPYRYVEDDWSLLQIELRDIDDNLFCQGYVNWHCGNINYDPRFSWYDKRVCAAIKGKLGLVNVNHSVFRSAIQVKVTVWSNLDSNVSGSIIASYGKYEYDTPYYKDRFRNVLFSESGESCCSIGCGQELPLQKSIISWPIDSSLIIELDLCSELEGVSETVQGVGEFRFKSGAKCIWKIEKNDFFFEVVVEWFKTGMDRETLMW